jgi:AraC family transcriptional regulator
VPASVPAPAPAAPTPWLDRILRATDHIHQHLDDDLLPEDLARIASFSLHHFHRVFRGITGESVMAYVRRLRMERAAQRLKYTAAPITEVAMASGYGSHEAFTRAFHGHFGESPSAYRDRAELPSSSAATILLRDEPARAGIAMRHVGSYEDCGRAWAELAAIAAASGFANRERASLGLCYDDPDVTEHARLRYDALLVLDPAAMPARIPPRCVSRTVPAGRYAVALHVGPFDTLPDTYLELLGHWLPRRGLELADEPVVEAYLDDPHTTAPADMRTEVCVRIA